MTPQSARKGSHRADPVWYDRRDNIICKLCRKSLVGNGTTKDPWRHAGESVDAGVLG